MDKYIPIKTPVPAIAQKLSYDILIITLMGNLYKQAGTINNMVGVLE